MTNQEKIRELLEKAKHMGSGKAGHIPCRCSKCNCIREALALLKQEPTVENFEVPKGFTLVNDTSFIGPLLKLAPESCETCGGSKKQVRTFTGGCGLETPWRAKVVDDGYRQDEERNCPDCPTWKIRRLGKVKAIVYSEEEANNYVLNNKEEPELFEIEHPDYKPESQEPEPCEMCKGSGRKPRENHCGVITCVKTHGTITCSPDGVDCEYYIPEEPCPDCKPESQEPDHTPEVGEKDESFPDKIKRLNLQDYAYPGTFILSLIDEGCELLEAATKRAEDANKNYLEEKTARWTIEGVAEKQHEEIKQLQSNLKTAEGVIEKLKKYTIHFQSCNIESETYVWEKGCTCGLDQALGKKGDSDE